jgi:hypothetical protein
MNTTSSGIPSGKTTTGENSSASAAMMTVCNDQLRLDGVATCAVILRPSADEKNLPNDRVDRAIAH